MYVCDNCLSKYAQLECVLLFLTIAPFRISQAYFINIDFNSHLVMFTCSRFFGHFIQNQNNWKARAVFFSLLAQVTTFNIHIYIVFERICHIYRSWSRSFQHSIYILFVFVWVDYYLFAEKAYDFRRKVFDFEKSFGLNVSIDE